MQQLSSFNRLFFLLFFNVHIIGAGISFGQNPAKSTLEKHWQIGINPMYFIDYDKNPNIVIKSPRNANHACWRADLSYNITINNSNYERALNLGATNASNEYFQNLYVKSGGDCTVSIGREWQKKANNLLISYGVNLFGGGKFGRNARHGRFFMENNIGTKDSEYITLFKNKKLGVGTHFGLELPFNQHFALFSESHLYFDYREVNGHLELYDYRKQEVIKTEPGVKLQSYRLDFLPLRVLGLLYSF